MTRPTRKRQNGEARQFSPGVLHPGRKTLVARGLKTTRFLRAHSVLGLCNLKPVFQGPVSGHLPSHLDYFTHGHQLSVMTVSVVSASSVRQSPPTYLCRNLSVPARNPRPDKRRPPPPPPPSSEASAAAESDTLEARAKLTSDSALELGGLPRLPAPRTLQEGQRRSQV